MSVLLEIVAGRRRGGMLGFDDVRIRAAGGGETVGGGGGVVMFKLIEKRE